MSLKFSDNFLLFSCKQIILVSLAKRDSVEYRCPATAIILHKDQICYQQNGLKVDSVRLRSHVNVIGPLVRCLILFTIAWWPFAGKELFFWLSSCAVLLYAV